MSRRGPGKALPAMKGVLLDLVSDDEEVPSTPFEGVLSAVFLSYYLIIAPVSDFLVEASDFEGCWKSRRILGILSSGLRLLFSSF